MRESPGARVAGCASRRVRESPGARVTAGCASRRVRESPGARVAGCASRRLGGCRRRGCRGPSVRTTLSVMSYQADPRVDRYIQALPDWQQAICQQVRDLVHEADPEVVETIRPPCSPISCTGNICALLAAKDHVNVFLYDGAIVPRTRKGSSPPGTRTARPAPSRFAGTNRSTPPPCWRCSGRSSPTTGQAAGAESKPGPDQSSLVGGQPQPGGVCGAEIEVWRRRSKPGS